MKKIPTEITMRLYTSITVNKLENYCLYSQFFTSLLFRSLSLPDVATHLVPVVNWPTVWCWSGHFKVKQSHA